MNDCAFFQVEHRLEDLSRESIEFAVDLLRLGVQKLFATLSQIIQQRAVLHEIRHQTELLLVAEERHADDAKHIRVFQTSHDVSFVQQLVDLLVGARRKIPRLGMKTLQSHITSAFVQGVVNSAEVAFADLSTVLIHRRERERESRE